VRLTPVLEHRRQPNPGDGAPMSKAEDDRTRSLTRREALKGVAAVPTGVLTPRSELADTDSPEGDLARLRGLMAAFTAAQEKAWHMREELEEALFAARQVGDTRTELAPPPEVIEPLREIPDDELETAVKSYEQIRVDAREAVIAAPARTLTAVAAKLRWVAQEYTSWFDEDCEDEVETRAGRQVLQDLEALAGL